MGRGDKTLYTAQQICSMLDDFVAQVDGMVEDGVVPDPSPDCYYIIIIGSSTFIYEGIVARKTVDIDIYEKWLPQDAVDLFPDHAMNQQTKIFGDSAAYNYEDRLATTIEGKYCIVYRPSWEDLVFMKLQRAEYKDLYDVRNLLDFQGIDWRQLDFLMTDPEESVGCGRTRRAYHELLLAYNNLLEEYGFEPMPSENISKLLDNAL